MKKPAARTVICNHDLAEKEPLCADGHCPACSAEGLDALMAGVAGRIILGGLRKSAGR